MSNQARENYFIYDREHRERLEQSNPDGVVLMHDGKIIGDPYGDTEEEYERAYADGFNRYGLGNFSLVQIGQKPVQLGAMTLAFQ